MSLFLGMLQCHVRLCIGSFRHGKENTSGFLYHLRCIRERDVEVNDALLSWSEEGE